MHFCFLISVITNSTSFITHKLQQTHSTQNSFQFKTAEKKSYYLEGHMSLLFQLWFSECSSRLQRTHFTLLLTPEYCAHLALPTSRFTVFHKTFSRTKHERSITPLTSVWFIKYRSTSRRIVKKRPYCNIEIPFVTCNPWKVSNCTTSVGGRRWRGWKWELRWVWMKPKVRPRSDWSRQVPWNRGKRRLSTFSMQCVSACSGNDEMYGCLKLPESSLISKWINGSINVMKMSLNSPKC